MKHLIIATLLATLSTPYLLKAEDIALPNVSKPSALEEGIQRDLTSSQIAELLPWAKDSKAFLNDLLDNINGLTSQDKYERLVEGIQNVVGESSSKHSELLMRYALNRGLVLVNILNKESDDQAVGSVDAKIRVLLKSIELANKYYDIDLEVLTKKTNAPYIVFGIEYFEFLNELNKSIFDASAQYNIMRTSFEWLQWDLYRDINNAKFAPQILKINNSLKVFSTRKMTDAQYIANIRQMKSLAQQLKVREALEKTIKDAAFARAKTEEERRHVLEKIEREKYEAEMAKNGGSATIRANTSAIQIVDNNYYHVTVRTIYSNGKADVIYTDAKYSGQTDVVSVSSLSYPLSKMDKFEVGKRAVQTSGTNKFHVQIDEIYVNKKASVTYLDEKYMGQSAVVSLSDLSYSVEKRGNLYVGADAIQVVDGNIYHIQIEELFADGKVGVVYTDQKYFGQRGIIEIGSISLKVE